MFVSVLDIEWNMDEVQLEYHFSYDKELHQRSPEEKPLEGTGMKDFHY